MYLTSDLVTGLVAVGIRPLPFKGVHLLLGNDFAGDKVVEDPLSIRTTCVDQPPDPIKQENQTVTLLVLSQGQWKRKPNRSMVGYRILI